MTEGGAHLVLGGSHGIGYAYARRRAAEGSRLILVARNRRDLGSARRKLTQRGALSVDVVAGDLLDAAFREELRDRLANERFATILVGGPSPPPGTLAEIDASELAAAVEAALVYPFELIKWALGPVLLRGGEMIIVGSSASHEPLCDHPFFCSALLRRALDLLVSCMEPAFHAARKRLTVWRPKVVLTRLARRYARNLNPRASTLSDVCTVLRHHFGETPVDPTTFVGSRLDPGSD